MRKLRILVGVSAVGLLTACPEKTAVWVSPGSTSQHLVFEIGQTRNGPPAKHVYWFAVAPCGKDDKDAALWALAQEQEADIPRQVVYGETPRGYRVVRGPAALQAGCYQVAVSGSGRTLFDVGGDGQITEHANQGD